jgi:hypothetical protein
LEWLKTDPLVDPLRKEPHLRAIEPELKFPNQAERELGSMSV